MQKNRSLGPGILEALLTKVKSPFHRMKGHVTGSAVAWGGAGGARAPPIIWQTQKNIY